MRVYSCVYEQRPGVRRESGGFLLMRFCLLDRIVSLEPGKQIKAVKELRAEEDYLRDHFPLFPVMPGVLMLEALFQASMWLVRESQDFRRTAVLLKEAKSVKYSDFVAPGQQLEVEAQILKQNDDTTSLKARGLVSGEVAVSGRLILEHFDYAEQYPHQALLDHYCRNEMRKTFRELCEAGAA